MRLFGPPNIEKMKAKKDVKGLIKALGYKKSDPIGQSATIRKAAAQALGKLGDPQAVDPLITALKDEEILSSVKTAALEALGQIGDARAVDPLIDILMEENSQSLCAAKALGEIGDARAVEPLITALKSKYKFKRQAASEALVRIGAPAGEPLTTSLKDKDRDARQAVAETQDKLNWRPRKDVTGAYYWIIKKDWKRCVSIGSLAVEPLSAELKEGDRDVRQAAAQALGKIGDARAVEPLLAALKDTDGDVRRAAAAALDKLHWQPLEDETGVYYWIIKKDWSRCVSAGALAVKPLIATLEEKDQDVRKAAAETLGKIGDARAVKPLIAMLNEKDLRQTVVDALVETGIPALEPLMAALKSEDKDWGERLAAAEALVKIGTPSVELFCVMLQDEKIYIQELAAQALGRIGDARAVEPLMAALKSKDWGGVRQAAAQALGKIGDARAVKSLIAALKDEVAIVRQAAAEALDTLDWQPGKTVEGSAYWIARQEWNRCVQIGSLAVESLIAALKYKEPDVRREAAIALVSLYSSDKLEDRDKQSILALRSAIIGTSRPHSDGDHEVNCEFQHFDIPAIIVEFPL